MALLDAVVPNVEGVILLFRGQLAVSGKNFREEYSWHLVRKLKEAAKHPTVHRTEPVPPYNYPAQISVVLRSRNPAVFLIGKSKYVPILCK